MKPDVNTILNSGAFREPKRPTFAAAFGTVDSAPSAGWLAVLIDGDDEATEFRYCSSLASCTGGERVIVILIGASRVVIEQIALP